MSKPYDNPYKDEMPGYYKNVEKEANKAVADNRNRIDYEKHEELKKKLPQDQQAYEELRKLEHARKKGGKRTRKGKKSSKKSRKRRRSRKKRKT